jgi:hypothetical protein
MFRPDKTLTGDGAHLVAFARTASGLHGSDARPDAEDRGVRPMGDLLTDRGAGPGLLAGLMAAHDPENQAGPVEGPATTTSRSPWHRTLCPVCRHTFRRGDRVEVEAVAGGRRVVHASEDLACARWVIRQGGGPRPVDAFFRGMDAAWPPPDRVVRLNWGHELLAEPPLECRRRSCAFCGHTFRHGDVVIICPCSPPPALCAAAIHRDPQKGLNCWESLYPAGIDAADQQRHCPVGVR